MTDFSTLPITLKTRDLTMSTRLQLIGKRAIDIVVSAVGLVLVFPLLVAVGILVRLDSPGAALFRQARVGLGGRQFRIVKFRTMVKDAETLLATDEDLRERHRENNFKLATDHDPRVTRVGRFLRGASLDELPQLWNVLRGEMSLVGPRPVPEDHFLTFGKSKGSYVAMRPGITGSWQVAGRSHVTHEMPALTDYYVENWSLGLDLRILLKTLPAVVRRHGAY